MKRIFQLCFSLAIFSFGFSQDLKPVAEKVKQSQQSNKTFVKYNIFTKDNSAQKQALYDKAAEGITVMQLNKSEVQRINAEKPDALEMTFPFEGKTITVELVKNNFFTQDFKVNTDKGYVDYTPGVYYQGIVKGDQTSLVAMSFFNDEVMGVTSVENVGNIVLGKTKNSGDFVSYNDHKMKAANPFTCGADQLAENNTANLPTFDPKTMTAKKTDNCVRIYYETGFNIYTNFSSSTATVTNWVTAMHNNISTLYTNDGITVALSEVFVWTSTDPYNGSGTAARLNQFRDNRQNFNGDIAQLIKYNNPVSGGIAFLNSLCGSNNHSYVDVFFTYSNVPSYSWNIEAMTHEIGHGLGSPHTHACKWNGNNTAIDGCGPASGNNEGCNAALPTGGGTIMSYCHLVSGVGINFTKGFGPQPGALIRNTVNTKTCLGTDCISSCSSTIAGVSISNVTQTSVTATIVDNTGTSWKYRVATGNGTTVTSGVTTNKVINISSLSPGNYYVISIGAECSGPQAFSFNQLILTDANWCSGIQFTDPGGPTANYGDNQSVTKTFYPAVSTDKLKLTFTEFDLEVGADFMNVYDGTSTGSARFPGGTQISGNTIPGPFQATNPAGAITVRFISNANNNLAGWKATFECLTLATGENAFNNKVEISKTGTKGMFSITSKDKILSYQVFDASGKMVKAGEKMNATQYQLDLSNYPAGNYVVNVITASGSVVKKVIR